MNATDPPTEQVRSAREMVECHKLWYHTIELAPGLITPGWFDLRPVIEQMPWPEVRGKRCLDLGPWDGQLAFELERRGATEVVAADISDQSEWDFSWADRQASAGTFMTEKSGDPGVGFEIAKQLLGSRVERIECSAYDLSPERTGRFDVVVCGSLLLHLRDPVRALEAIRGVCNQYLLSAETISPGLQLLSRRRPLALMRNGLNCQWWIPNAAGHREMVRSAGFEIERQSRPYAIRLGEAHPARSRQFRSPLARLKELAATGGIGVPHAAVLAQPLG